MCKYFYSMLVLVFISCSGTKPKMLLPEKVSPDVYEVLLENKTVKEIPIANPTYTIFLATSFP